MGKHSRCVAWGVSGLLIGLAVTAYAQEGPIAHQAMDPTGTEAILRLIQGGGLPAVFALLGWLAGRKGGIPVVLSLHADDRKLLEDLRRRED